MPAVAASATGTPRSSHGGSGFVGARLGFGTSRGRCGSSTLRSWTASPRSCAPGPPRAEEAGAEGSGPAPGVHHAVCRGEHRGGDLQAAAPRAPRPRRAAVGHLAHGPPKHQRPPGRRRARPVGDRLRLRAAVEGLDRNPADPTAVVEAAQTERAINQKGEYLEAARVNAIARSSFASGTTGLTFAGTGVNGSAIAVDTTDLLFEQITTVNSLRFTAGSPHGAELRASFPATASWPGAALLGAGVLGLGRRARRGNDPRIHPQPGGGGQAAGSAETAVERATFRWLPGRA
jgi:hypothetical protein